MTNLIVGCLISFGLGWVIRDYTLRKKLHSEVRSELDDIQARMKKIGK